MEIKEDQKENINNHPIVEYRKVNIERAHKNVLQDVTFSLNKGNFYYLIGRVGSGKSSLMKTIYADLPAASGEKMNVLDYDLLKIKTNKIPYLRRKIGIVFQDFQLLQDRTVSGNLKFVLNATGWKHKGEIDGRIDEVLRMVGMANKSYKMPHELSGGEQQRIVIARALLNKPELIIADEPTGNLDPQTGYHIVTLLHELVDNGHCVMMATHNLQLVEEFPGKVLKCESKHLYSEG